MTSLPPLIEGLIGYACLVFVITVHESAHAWTADRCGDPTARLLGRVTWNPLPHLDMIGTVLLPLLMFIGPAVGIGAFTGLLIGWGKPVPVDPRNFRNGMRDDMLVSFAGPLSNIVMAVVALAVVRAALFVAPQADLVHAACGVVLLPMAQLAFFLAFFNLIPLPPLDGSHLLRPLLGFEGRQVYDRIAQYGFIVLIILVNTRLFDLFAIAVGRLFAGLAAVFGL